MDNGFVNPHTESWSRARVLELVERKFAQLHDSHLFGKTNMSSGLIESGS